MMNNLNKHLTQKSGFALITVLVISLVLLLIITFYLLNIISEAKITKNQIADSKTFYIADAGYNKALNYIKLYPGLVESGTELSGTLSGIDWQAIIDLLSAENDPTKIYQITIEVTDPITGVRKKITAIIQIQTFAKYAYYTNQEVSAAGSTVWFVGVPSLTDVLGRRSWVSPDQTSQATIHTNTRFAFYGNPEFWANVESVNQTALFYDTITHQTYTLNADSHSPGAIPVFKKNFTRGVDSIPFPSNINSIDAAPAGQTITAPSGATIALNGNQATINGTNYDISDILLIRSNGNLNVSGTLNGQLTIATTGKIYILDNLIYANESPTSDDVLGLFAEDDIIVKNNENVSPGVGKNIRIDASILSLDRFSIYPFNGGDANNPIGRKPCATLQVNGGIIQQVRGVMGHFSLSSGCIDGYIKDYRYDNRLLTTPPPYFPTTGEPEIISWKEEIIE